MTCRKCNLKMQPGRALVNVAAAGAPDFIGSREAVTYSFSGAVKMIDVLKCPKCGFSRTDKRGSA